MITTQRVASECQGYLPMKRAKRVKWQAPPEPQSIRVVAEGDPYTHDR